MKFRIACLDDEPAICDVIKESFETPSVEIVTFVIPSQAIEFVNRLTCNLVFIDYRLPGTTGDQVARAMPAGIPKILITGEFGLPDLPEFVKVFTKPFKIREIQEIIDHYISLQKAS